LVYSDGVQVVIDFNPLIERGGVFASLADPMFFARVTVGEGGRYIVWPGDLDFCADALREQGRKSNLQKQSPDAN
jgi:hypothetical protein